MSQDRAFVFKSHRKQLGWPWKLNGGQGLRESPGWSKQCELGWWSLKMAPACHLCWAQKRNKGLCKHLSGRKLIPIPTPNSFPDARHFSPSSYVSGAFQAPVPVLELKGSESRIRTCVDPLRTAWDSRNTISLSFNPHWGFYSQNLWGFLFLHWNPGLGDLEHLTPQGWPL